MIWVLSETMKHKHDSYVCHEFLEKDYILNYTITGKYWPGTRNDPPEYPEVELCCIERDDPANPGMVADEDYERLGIFQTRLEELSERALENAERAAEPEEWDR